MREEKVIMKDDVAAFERASALNMQRKACDTWHLLLALSQHREAQTYTKCSVDNLMPTQIPPHGLLEANKMKFRLLSPNLSFSSFL